MTLSARLEIHQINVGQGDSILIINRDLDKVKAKILEAINKRTIAGPLPAEPIDYVPFAVFKKIDLEGTVNRALLIDGGEDFYGAVVLQYAKEHGAFRVSPAPFCPELYMLISHPHDDHQAGLRSVLRMEVPPYSFYDPKKKKSKTLRTKERYRPACFYQVHGGQKMNPPDTGFFNWMEGDITGASNAANNRTERRIIYSGGLSKEDEMMTIDLGKGVDDIPIKLYALAANQGVYKRNANPTPIKSKTGKVDQNDRSIVLMLEYGSFRYFLGGDIAGSGVEAGGNTGANKMHALPANVKHANVEGTLGPALEEFFPATKTCVANKPKYPSDGYCTVMKANHHGSDSSCDVYLLATLRPLVAIISSGMKVNFHHHPTQAVINRLSKVSTPNWGLRPDGRKTTPNTVAQVYVTEVADRVAGKTFAVDLRGAKILGDIVIRPTDESILEVHKSANFGKEVKVQVYGTGDLTNKIKNPTKNKLRDPEAKAGTYQNWTYIGPFYHSDVH